MPTVIYKGIPKSVRVVENTYAAAASNTVVFVHVVVVVRVVERCVAARAITTPATNVGLRLACLW